MCLSSPCPGGHGRFSRVLDIERTGGATPWSAARTAAITARSMSRTLENRPCPPAFHHKSGGGGRGRAISAARFEATAVGVVSLGF